MMRHSPLPRTLSVLALVVCGGQAFGQAEKPSAQPLPAGPAPTAQPAAPAAGKLSAADLDTLLGPIALYADALIAQILPASTYPLDIVMAARWVKVHPDLKDVDEQAWDPSVRAVAHYPTIITMMDERIDWTQQLGRAFLEQRQDVMESVQRLRAQAHAAGSLQTTPQQQVVSEGTVIKIVPAEPQVIYVPQYQPSVVYGGSYYGDTVGASLVSFGVGFAAGSWLNLGCDWGSHCLYHYPYWGFSVGWGWPYWGCGSWGWNSCYRPCGWGWSPYSAYSCWPNSGWCGLGPRWGNCGWNGSGFSVGVGVGFTSGNVAVGGTFVAADSGSRSAGLLGPAPTNASIAEPAGQRTPWVRDDSRPGPAGRVLSVRPADNIARGLVSAPRSAPPPDLASPRPLSIRPSDLLRQQRSGAAALVMQSGNNTSAQGASATEQQASRQRVLSIRPADNIRSGAVPQGKAPPAPLAMPRSDAPAPVSNATTQPRSTPRILSVRPADNIRSGAVPDPRSAPAPRGVDTPRASPAPAAPSESAAPRILSVRPADNVRQSAPRAEQPRSTAPRVDPRPAAPAARPSAPAARPQAVSPAGMQRQSSSAPRASSSAFAGRGSPLMRAGGGGGGGGGGRSGGRGRN